MKTILEPSLARANHLFEQGLRRSETGVEAHSGSHGSFAEARKSAFNKDLISRIGHKYPYPLIAHHFGLPSMKETLEAIREIALSGVLDLISIDTDQNASESFFRPDLMNSGRNGVGGTPLRDVKDLTDLYRISRCGNFPLIGCDAGTRDPVKWSEMSIKSFHNALAAIPLTWNNYKDDGSRPALEEVIAENQRMMRWYAKHHIPVEVNESLQWSSQNAHDSLVVAMAFLAAYNAKKMGVKNYIAQFMFNTPSGTKPAMDLAKMSAMLHLIEGLEDDSFKVWREVQIGAGYPSSDQAVAKGQLAASASVAMTLKPHILNVVRSGNAVNHTRPDELIENCRIINGVINDNHDETTAIISDLHVLERKFQLIYEARMLLEGFKFLGADSDDPMTDPYVIARAIREGILDTPQSKETQEHRGDIRTSLVNGGWYAIDPSTGDPFEEECRLRTIFTRIKQQN